MRVSTLSKERLLPFLFGASIVGVYYKLYKSDLSGVVFKVHILGLGIASISGAHKFNNPKTDAIRLVFPLIIASSILYLKKEFRKNGAPFLLGATIQAVGMQILFRVIISQKQKLAHLHSYLSRRAIHAAIEDGNRTLNSFSYEKDQIEFLKKFDLYKCQAISLLNNKLESQNTLNTQDTIGTIAKSISDPLKKINALGTLATKVSRENVLPLLKECDLVARPEDQNALDQYKLTIFTKLCSNSTFADVPSNRNFHSCIEAVAKSISDPLKKINALGTLATKVSGKRALELLQFCDSIANSEDQNTTLDQHKLTTCRNLRSNHAFGYAETIAKSISDPHKKIDAFGTLAARTSGKKALELLQACDSIANSQDQNTTLDQHKLTTCKNLYSNRNFHDYAEAVANSISDPHKKIDALGTLATKTSGEKALQLLQSCGSIASSEDQNALDQYKLTTCKNLCSNRGFYGYAEAVANSISDPHKKIDALGELATKTSGGKSLELLQFCDSIANSKDQNITLDQHKLTTCKNLCSNRSFYGYAEAVANSISDPHKKIDALGTLATKTSGEKALQLLQFCDSIASLEDQNALGQRKLTICRSLCSNRDFYHAEIIAKSISNLYKKIEALCFLAKKNPSKEQEVHNYFKFLKIEARPLHIQAFLAAKRNPHTSKILIPPEEFDFTGLTRSQWKEIKNIFKRIFFHDPNPTSQSFYIQKRALGGYLRRTQKTLSVSNGQQTISINIPFTIKFFIINGKLNFVLIPKKVIGRGSEKAVKLVYNLTTGENYACKKVQKVEADSLRMFASSIHKRGLPRLIRSEVVANGEKIYQPFFRYNLNQAISKNLLRTRNAKLTVIENILTALCNLHKHTTYVSYPVIESNFPSSLYDWRSRNSFVQQPQLVKTTKHDFSFPFMHNDIKPANIVINEKTLEIMLIDLGMSHEVSGVAGTIMYIDPNTLRCLRDINSIRPPIGLGDLKSINALPKHYSSHGQKKDVWGVGLVIAAILFGLENKLPKLAFLQNCVQSAVLNTPWGELNECEQQKCMQEKILFHIESLRQWDIDDCLTNIDIQKDEPLTKLLQKMLRIDSKKRYTAQQALNLFRSLKNASERCDRIASGSSRGGPFG